MSILSLIHDFWNVHISGEVRVEKPRGCHIIKFISCNLGGHRSTASYRKNYLGHYRNPYGGFDSRMNSRTIFFYEPNVRSSNFLRIWGQFFSILMNFSNKMPTPACMNAAGRDHCICAWGWFHEEIDYERNLLEAWVSLFGIIFLLGGCSKDFFCLGGSVWDYEVRDVLIHFTWDKCTL